MIEIADLYFSFGDKKIFDNLNVCFEEGNFISVIGPNGSGKTTLLKIVSGMYKTTSGRVFIDGTDISCMSRLDISKKIGVLHQEKIKTSVSVYDMIASGRYPYHGSFGKLTEKDKSIIISCAKMLGVDSFLEKDIRRLSGGERQRVYIASVLSQSTQYILLDEPNTFLDIANKFDIMSFLKNACNKGTGVIAILHDISLAMKYSDKILILDKENSISKILTPGELYESNLFEMVFKVKCERIILNGSPEYIFIPM